MGEKIRGESGLREASYWCVMQGRTTATPAEKTSMTHLSLNACKVTVAQYLIFTLYSASQLKFQHAEKKDMN